MQAHARFRCTPLDLGDRSWPARVSRTWLARTFRGDVVLLLHSVFSNACFVPDWLADALRRLPQPKVYFIGNEYKLMPEKMAFAERAGVTLLVSQTQATDIHAAYRRRLGCAAVGIPNTGLDESIFRPAGNPDDRPIDLGYRADDAPSYLGHRERRDMAEYFQSHARRHGLLVDISLSRADRFTEPEWAAFLNRCRGQLGTEAGGDYFDLDDGPRRAVNTFVAAQPNATYEEIHERFFRDRPPTPLRILSGRQVEAAGTKTAQILFDGQYDGFFVPDRHYIPLRKDFSNVEEAVSKFRDRGVRSRIAEEAYALARSEFTYARLIDRVHQAVAPLL
jgi:hypothetical protein